MLIQFNKNPTRLATHNGKSWIKILSLFKKYKRVTMDQLTHAVSGHKHYGTETGDPEKFIKYCIQRQWLIEV